MHRWGLNCKGRGRERAAEKDGEGRRGRRDRDRESESEHLVRRTEPSAVFQRSDRTDGMDAEWQRTPYSSLIQERAEVCTFGDDDFERERERETQGRARDEKRGIPISRPCRRLVHLHFSRGRSEKKKTYTDSVAAR